MRMYKLVFLARLEEIFSLSPDCDPVDHFRDNGIVFQDVPLTFVYQKLAKTEDVVYPGNYPEIPGRTDDDYRLLPDELVTYLSNSDKAEMESLASEYCVDHEASQQMIPKLERLVQMAKIAREKELVLLAYQG